MYPAGPSNNASDPDVHSFRAKKRFGICGLRMKLPVGIVLLNATPTFATSQNLFNLTRNFTFVAIVALGMMAAIVTGGADTCLKH
jgi:ribose/xylose/arabinose/galactoside ABC-type transport system permease subunit